VESAENIKSQMKKGVLELCVLSILQQKESYPSDVIENMNKAQLNIPEGTLYPILTRLKNAGFVTYKWVESTEGPPRKYFSLSDTGQQHLQAMQQSWQEFIQNVNKLLNNK
jgi:PadR family transcriptional regulator, regulatory protein PadR